MISDLNPTTPQTQVAVLSYVQNQAIMTGTDRHTDNTDNSIITAKRGKYLIVFN